MAKLIKIKSSDGEIDVLIPESEADISPVGIIQTTVETIEAAAEGLFGSVAVLARQFENSLAGLHVSTAELEVSMQFSAEGKVYIVNAKGQASLTARIRLASSGNAPPA